MAKLELAFAAQSHVACLSISMFFILEQRTPDEALVLMAGKAFTFKWGRKIQLDESELSL